VPPAGPDVPGEFLGVLQFSIRGAAVLMAAVNGIDAAMEVAIVTTSAHTWIAH